MKLTRSEVIYLIALIIVGILSRTVFKSVPNFEIVTAISVCAAFFVKSKVSYLVAISIIAVSDLILQNSNIILFTWSGFVIGHFISKAIEKLNLNRRFVSSMLAGMTSVGIFFLWTNLGVVLLTNMYSHNFAGLMQSYTNALPFVRPQLVSTLLFVPIIYTVSHIFFNYQSYSWVNYLKHHD